ncbi:serine/threonine protein kinase [bacterium]|nr:serine/threonine protein kinase [bacterium]QQR59213.1 MAG: serine/threonine protein kinase [Candidatus Melainabacteria bacterium]
MTCPKCGLVAGGGVTLCPKDGTKLADYSNDPFVGKIIEQKYEIISPIGEGGMSVVYKAKHLLMDRFVAIKMIRPEYATMSQLIDRFKQETKAVSSLRHPNIVTVFDYGFLPDQTPFLIMDYLEGKVLNQLIKQEKTMHWERAVLLFSQACDALAHSHERGVVHRDIKPSNLLVRQELEGVESLTIFDFGIAKLLNPDGKKLTNLGEVFGSPLYMSPEQCSGDMIDPRTDVYSLACVIYEALVGVPPLVGAKPIETIMKHINDKPRTLSEVRPDLNIPPRLEEMVMTALSKAPIDRQPNMITFRNELLSVANLKMVATGVSVMLDPNEVLRALEQNNNAPSNTPHIQQPGSSNSRLNAVSPNTSSSRLDAMEQTNPRQSANRLQPSLQVPSDEYVTDPPHIKENRTIEPIEMQENPFRPVPLPPEVVLSGQHTPFEEIDEKDKQVKKTTVIQKKSASPVLMLSIVAVLILGAVGGYLVAHPEVLQGNKTEDVNKDNKVSDEPGLEIANLDSKAQKEYVDKAYTYYYKSYTLSARSSDEVPLDCHENEKIVSAIPFNRIIPPHSCHIIVQGIASKSNEKGVHIDMVAEELTRKFFKNDPRVIATKMESLGFTPIDDELNTRCTLVKAKVAGKTQYFLYVWNDQKCVVCQFAVADDMPIMNLQGEMREISTVIINEYNGN